MNIRKMLYGLEYFFDGLICDHLVFDVKPADKGWKIAVHVRKWHPSYWLGYIRCRWLGDLCRSAYYKKD